jgi:hypothetical protein
MTGFGAVWAVLSVTQTLWPSIRDPAAKAVSNAFPCGQSSSPLASLMWPSSPTSTMPLPHCFALPRAYSIVAYGSFALAMMSEGNRNLPGVWIGETGGFDGKDLASRISETANEECARDRCRGDLLPVCNQKACQTVSNEQRRLRSGANARSSAEIQSLSSG